MPFLNTQFTLSTTAIKTSCCSPKTHRVCIKLQNHFPLGGCKLAGLYSYKTSPFLLPLVIFLLREASPKEGVNIPLSFAKAGKSRPLPTSSCTRSRCWARYWSCQEFLTTWPLSGEPDFAERRQEEAITKWKLEVARPQTVTKNSSDRVPVMDFWNANDSEYSPHSSLYWHPGTFGHCRVLLCLL